MSDSNPEAAVWSEDRRRAAYALRDRLATVATTGTNGKTTTTSMIGAIVAASGEPSAIFTTLGAVVDGITSPSRAGNPARDPATTAPFLSTVESAVARGVKTLALEVTSLALARGMATRWPPDVAVFTNLTRDHLDVHGSPEAYLAAKAQLFLHLRPGGTAVLNLDDPSSALLQEILGADRRVLTYSLHDPSADLAASDVSVSVGATRVSLARGAIADRLGPVLEIGTTGHVHAANALAATLAAVALDYPPEAVRAGLAGFRGVAGRFQHIPSPRPDAPAVFVDYAHTPDGLENTLRTARTLLDSRPDSERGRLICVFGCGGGRDRGKRPEMGAIADALADVVCLTTDNPRHEAPESIAADVVAGVPTPRAEWTTVHDRRAAIGWAVAKVGGPKDVVIVAGKGHETDQIVGDAHLPFDDVTEVRAAFDAR